MQVFRNLFIHGKYDQIDALMVEVERNLEAGWTRDRDEEDRMKSLAYRPARAYCFTCNQQGGRPAATVFLMDKDKEPDTYYATNVAPRKEYQLTYEQYNGILGEFAERFVLPCAQRLGLRADLTATDVDLENWLSRDAAERLRRFSHSANKSTGSGHPCDQEQWLEFILASGHEGNTLDGSTLRRWLTETEGWSPEMAQRLADEYEFGRDLLTFQEGRRSA
jgi:hypothetical protein